MQTLQSRYPPVGWFEAQPGIRYRDRNTRGTRYAKTQLSRGFCPVRAGAPGTEPGYQAPDLRPAGQSDQPGSDLDTATVTRNYAFLVFETLYGLDAKLNPHPQMAEGHVVEDDGKRRVYA
jgi:hypothetical protein